MRGQRTRFGVLALAMVLLVAACGSDDKDSSTTTTKAAVQQSIGKGEGAISILAWPGYAENGSTDKTVDWVTPFEQETGCKASIKTFGTSDEAFQLFETGQYDVFSASGDATLRVVANGDATALNTDLLTNYKDLTPFLVGQRWNTVDDVVYGEPHGWGANLLMWNKDVVSPAPTDWGAVFEKDSPYKGKVTGYDSPIYIADAGLYLKNTQPDLKITDPYALDQKQFDAAVALMKQQKANIGEYWNDYLKEQEAFTKGSSVLGTTWQVITNLVQGDEASPPVEAILPPEGSTAWSDSWMIYSKTKHPNCSYEWLNWITKPDVQAQVAEWFGEAPANLDACSLTTDKDFCTGYHADDQAYYDQLSYWTTPTKKCLDGRTDVDCVAYKDWVSAWDEIKGELKLNEEPTREGGPERPALGVRRRIARVVARRPGLRLGAELSVPLTWLVVVYLGALAALIVTSLYSLQDDPTGLITRLNTSLSLDNFQRLWDTPVYREVGVRTLQAAVTVTIIDGLIALPIAFYMAKVASVWARRILVVAMTMPLWAGYLVKGYAWRAILDPGGGALQSVFGKTPGFGYSSTVLVLCYLWFPYMLIPIYAGLDRLPNSLLEASTDLGAKAGRTFTSVVLPQVYPALVAGSIFTFSLTLGDFYMNRIVGGTTEFIGNVVYRQFSVDLPFAAAYSTVPIVIMVVYLLAVRRTGALEEL